jgi:hypothetical protein
MNNMFFTLFVKTKGNISHDIKFHYKKKKNVKTIIKRIINS